jgi:hypothetical protein
MTRKSLNLRFPNVRLTSVALINDVWAVSAEQISNAAVCPRCQIVLPTRHSSYQRRYWDLPIQGRSVRITLTVGRWQCRNTDCGQSIFTERLPELVDPRSRQTRRAAGILRLLSHGVGGRLGERLAARLGREQSHWHPDLCDDRTAPTATQRSLARLGLYTKSF